MGCGQKAWSDSIAEKDYAEHKERVAACFTVQIEQRPTVYIEAKGTQETAYSLGEPKEPHAYCAYPEFIWLGAVPAGVDPTGWVHGYFAGKAAGLKEGRKLQAADFRKALQMKD